MARRVAIVVPRRGGANRGTTIETLLANLRGEAYGLKKNGTKWDRVDQCAHNPFVGMFQVFEGLRLNGRAYHVIGVSAGTLITVWCIRSRRIATTLQCGTRRS